MKVIIVGAGSTAQGVASILLSDRNFQVVGFTDKDNKSKGKKILDIEVIGSHDLLRDLFASGIHGAVVAIGYDNNLRERHFHRLREIGFEMVSAVHPSALIDRSANIGGGVVISPGCIISPMVKIEQNTILAPGVIIGAETQIADNVYIGIGCNISGGTFIKRNAFLSAGCSVAPFVTVGKNSKIKPGTSVVKNVPDKVRNKA